MDNHGNTSKEKVTINHNASEIVTETIYLSEGYVVVQIPKCLQLESYELLQGFLEDVTLRALHRSGLSKSHLHKQNQDFAKYGP